jgi:hypothetical protein
MTKFAILIIKIVWESSQCEYFLNIFLDWWIRLEITAIYTILSDKVLENVYKIFKEHI